MIRDNYFNHTGWRNVSARTNLTISTAPAMHEFIGICVQFAKNLYQKVELIK